jgi:hypothetical protein
MMKEMALWHTAVNLLRNDAECDWYALDVWGVESKEFLKMWEEDIGDMMYSIFGVGWGNPKQWKKGA